MSISEHSFGDTYSGAGRDAGPRSTPAEAPPSGPDGSQAAARLLEMTARETDRWRSEARGEAAAILAGAREEAERTVNDARVEAYRVREETTAVRKAHEEEIARLQQVATEHRERLRQHLNEMLDQVDSSHGGGRSAV